MALSYLCSDDFDCKDDLIIKDDYGRDGTTLVLFYSIECPHCKDMLKIFRKLPQKVSGINISILNINKNENKSLVMNSKNTENTKIEYVPYILLFHNGAAIARYDDAPDIDNILQFINETTQNITQSFKKEDPEPMIKPISIRGFGVRGGGRCYLNSANN